jgi:hypothetical protein
MSQSRRAPAGAVVTAGVARKSPDEPSSGALCEFYVWSSVFTHAPGRLQTTLEYRVASTSGPAVVKAVPPDANVPYQISQTSPAVPPRKGAHPWVTHPCTSVGVIGMAGRLPGTLPLAPQPHVLRRRPGAAEPQPPRNHSALVDECVPRMANGVRPPPECTHYPLAEAATGFRSTRRRWSRWDLRLSGAAMCAVAVCTGRTVRRIRENHS